MTVSSDKRPDRPVSSLDPKSGRYRQRQCIQVCLTTLAALSVSHVPSVVNASQRRGRREAPVTVLD